MLGKKKASSSTVAPASTGTTTTPLDPSIMALNGSLKNLADFQVQQGQQVLPKALGSLGTSENFYRTLLSGDRGAMSSLLGPQLNAIGEQGRSGLRSITELLPRSGATTDRIGDLTTSTTGQINDAMLNYRPAAANSLANIGGQYGSLASGLISGGGASNSAALSALLGQRGQDINAYLQQQAQKSENQRSLGQGIGSILGVLLGPGGILNKPKSSSSTSGGWGDFNPGYPSGGGG